MLTTAPRRPSAAAAVLLAVLLLFGTLTFVAGLVVGGSSDGSAAASSSPGGAVSSDAGLPSSSPAPDVAVETVTCAEPTQAWAALCDAYGQIRDEYVDEEQVTDEELVDGAIRGMVEYGLGDPYSGYLMPDQYGEALQDLSGEFSGIGAEVGMENTVNADDLAACTVITQTCAVVIVAPIDGSPAEEAGLQPGDRILEVDGQTTVGETLSSLVYLVRGEEGTDVTLTIERDGETFDVTITRGVIDLQEVSSELLDGGVGYVRLSSFTDRSTDLVREAVQSLLDDGATSFVLDLRGNPGGYIVAAQGVASQFVPEGELLFTVESDGSVQEWRAESGVAQSSDIPVVVLVDAGSASASEIVAAALQEAGRATVVGEPTFGKNTVQVWNDLPNGGGLRITTDRWFTPDHNSVAPDGVQPDVVVEGPTDPASSADPQLDRALELLRGR